MSEKQSYYPNDYAYGHKSDFFVQQDNFFSEFSSNNFCAYCNASLAASYYCSNCGFNPSSGDYQNIVSARLKIYYAWLDYKNAINSANYRAGIDYTNQNETVVVNHYSNNVFPQHFNDYKLSSVKAVKSTNYLVKMISIIYVAVQLLVWFLLYFSSMSFFDVSSTYNHLFFGLGCAANAIFVFLLARTFKYDVFYLGFVSGIALSMAAIVWGVKSNIPYIDGYDVSVLISFFVIAFIFQAFFVYGNFSGSVKRKLFSFTIYVNSFSAFILLLFFVIGAGFVVFSLIFVNKQAVTLNYVVYSLLSLVFVAISYWNLIIVKAYSSSKVLFRYISIISIFSCFACLMFAILAGLTMLDSGFA